MTSIISQTIKTNSLNREYHKWFSTWLQRDMEMLVFGTKGKPVLFFPTRTARFYDYEDWKVIEALRPKIEAGELQIFCVDSVDKDSFYSKTTPPNERIAKHEQFEKYILTEVLTFIKQKNSNPYIISAGCSLGAYHATNLAFRYPQFFSKLVAMSGRYDLTLKLQFFEDLFEGYWDQNVYCHMPTHYIPNIKNEASLALLRKMDITIVIGEEDAFLDNNYKLHEALIAKEIKHNFFVWKGEAHKAQYWSEMVKLYF